MTVLVTPYRAQFTRQSERLIQAFLDHTGVPSSAILVPAAGSSSYLTKQAGPLGTHGVSVGKHDLFLENLSALWPSDLEWPEDIPRPPQDRATFAQLPQEERDKLAARIAKLKNSNAA